MRNVKELVQKYMPKVIEYREYLHAHPELSHCEKETSAYLAQQLRNMGLPVTENVGQYGITAMIYGKGPGKCVGLRADFDALPIQEKTGLSCASQNPGVMHACGHDVHSALLLGAAHILLELRDTFDGSVKLIFQPAEEDAGTPGSKKMIAGGVLENPKLDAIFAQHTWPLLPVGKIGIRNGAMMAASDRFYITVHGKNSHGSAPENGIDAIVIAAQIISALQSIVSRNVGPLDSCVLTIGTIKGGNRYNIIADEVYMEGTCRNLSPAVRDKMPERMEKIIKGVAEGMGGWAELRYDMCYSPLINDPTLFVLQKQTIVDTVGQEGLVIPEQSALGGEDFSHYCKLLPTCFTYLGVQDESKPYFPLHNGEYAPSPKSFPIGVEFMVNTALNYLKG